LTLAPGITEKEAIQRSQTRRSQGIARPAEASPTSAATSAAGSSANSDLAKAMELSRTDFRGLDFSVDMLAGKSLESLMGDTEVARQVSALEYHRKIAEKQAEEEMKLALQMSAMEVGSLMAAPVPMDLDNDIELALRISAQEAAAPAPQLEQIPIDPAELPYVVQQCMEIGFPLEKVMAAYKKFRNDQAPPERVVENMTVYLINNA